MLVHVFHYIKKNKLLLFLIVPAFFFQMLVMMPSGTTICLMGNCGIHFWGVNSFDGMWHLEIAAVSFNQLPFVVPTYAGALLTGYNILLDFFIFLLSKIGIPPIITLFKIIPPVWFLFYTATLITLARTIKDSPFFVGCVLFTGYFAGHLGYLLPLYYEGSILVGSQSFALQPANILLNTQMALSFPALFGILILIQQKTFDVKTAFSMGLLTALIFGLKFYGGVISVFLVGLYVLEGFWKKKDLVFTVKQILIIGVIVGATVIFFYNPFQASKTGSIFIFAPFSTVHSMIEAQNMVHLPDMVNARYFLFENYPYSPRLLFIELFSTAIYVVLHFGTRVFGILYVLLRIAFRKTTRFELYVLSGTLVSIALSILLIQKGDWWNTVQFSYYGIFLSGILFAQLLYDLLQKKKWIFMIIALVILILTIPSNFRLIKDTFTITDTLYIPQQEFSALQKLKEQADGVVFTSFDLRDRYKKYPFMTYESTGYVSVFTNKQTYLGHFGPLSIIGVDYKPRYERVIEMDCTIFDEVEYVYWLRKQKKDFLRKCDVGAIFETIYEDHYTRVFKKK